MRADGRLAAPILRVARPTDQLEEVAAFYREDPGIAGLTRFADHDGFDGVILGHPQAPWHLEFTHRRGEAAVARLDRHGAAALPSRNPRRDREGRTYEDPDGYRIVVQNAAWTC